MKKKNTFLAVITIIPLLMTSCVTLMTLSIDNRLIRKVRILDWVFNPTLSTEQTSKVIFWQPIETYNGIDVTNWVDTSNLREITGDRNARGLRFIRMGHVPPGSSEFTFQASYTRETSNTITTYRVTDLTFSYNFEAGKEYTVLLGRELKNRGGLFRFDDFSYFIRIYDYMPPISNKRRITPTAYRAVNERKLAPHLLDSIHVFDTDVVEENIRLQRERERERERERN